MARYGRDPYWLTAKYRATCAHCHGDIKPGEQAFYFPNVKKLFCDMPKCGKKESSQFESAMQDDAFMSSQF